MIWLLHHNVDLIAYMLVLFGTTLYIVKHRERGNR